MFRTCSGSFCTLLAAKNKISIKNLKNTKLFFKCNFIYTVDHTKHKILNMFETSITIETNIKNTSFNYFRLNDTFSISFYYKIMGAIKGD